MCCQGQRIIHMAAEAIHKIRSRTKNNYRQGYYKQGARL